LIETLGGPHTPAVGWAAGIERLAMLVGDRGEPAPDVAVVAEHSDHETAALALVVSYRRAGIAAELVATGSPRKRFDRAKKLNPSALVSLDQRDGVAACSLKLVQADFGKAGQVQAVYDKFLLGQK
jgi:histidyl-tRNA synthetase